MRSAPWIAGALLVCLQMACNQILGLDQKSIQDASGDAGSGASDDTSGEAPKVYRECARNADCVGRATSTGETLGPAVCVPSERRCVRLLSPDCSAITGDFERDDAIVIASLLSTTGAQAATNLERQQSAVLAVEQINAAGGIPRGVPIVHQPLVLVSCDEVADLQRVAHHLVHELHVPAIIGPNTSQDTLDLSNQVTAAAGTLIISPTAVASSVADLLDGDLTWSMVPSDVQRAPLMLQQINALEAQLRRERNRQTVKLGVLFRDDALGAGTRSSLNSLVLNGKPISDPENLSESIKLSPYRVGLSEQAALIAEYVEFAPDIVVLAGTAEAFTDLVLPIERAWRGGARPQYLAIDSVKVPELLHGVADNEDLRARIRGTGVVPTAASTSVYEAFRLDYRARYPASNAGSAISGMGATYDATFAVAYAIAAMGAAEVTGTSIAQGLRRLASGTQVEVRSTKILAALQELAAGQTISALGTFGGLQWDGAGALIGGAIDVWCVGLVAGKPAFQSAGLTLDVATQQTHGTFVPCGMR